MNFVDNLNMYGVEAMQLPCIKGRGAPTKETAGAVGLLYMDTNNGAMYKCIAAGDGVYTWVKLAEGGVANEEKSLILTLFRNAAYTAPNMADTLAQLEELWGGGGDVPDVPDEPDEPVGTTYTITAELVNVASSNRTSSVTEGASYSTTLTANEGYEISSVTVFMGGVDVTADVYADGVISIPAVTGNVEIVASAVVVETEAVLPENGLIAFFDLRNVDKDAINTVNSCGTAHGIPTATKGSASLYSWGAWVDATDDYGTTIKRMLSVGAENTSAPIDLGTAYTFVGFTYGSYSACNHNGVGNGWVVNPKYIKSDGSQANVGVTTILGGVGDKNEGYLVTTTRVNGAELAFFADTEQVATFNGADYDNFVKWASEAQATVTPYTNAGKFTAFALYNRVLTDIEIAEAVAYLKTLEVA